MLIRRLLQVLETIFFFDNPLLPPCASYRRTVILDLEESLSNSKAESPLPEHFDFAFRQVIDGDAMNFYLQKHSEMDRLCHYAGEERVDDEGEIKPLETEDTKENADEMMNSYLFQINTVTPFYPTI